jgi:hypothetical protein
MASVVAEKPAADAEQEVDMQEDEAPNQPQAEDGSAEAAGDGDEQDKDTRYKKRKVAVFLGYVGAGYHVSEYAKGSISSCSIRVHARMTRMACTKRPTSMAAGPSCLAARSLHSSAATEP